MVKPRESNMELLRIIAILMITFHHFLLRKYYGGIVSGAELTNGWQWAVMFNGFAYVGVNVFVLISGYFGIRFKWKGVLNLFVFCAYYMALTLTFEKLDGCIDLSAWEICVKSCKAMWDTDAWFIKCYIALYFLSPLLNAAIDNMSKQQWRTVLLLLSVYCLGFGYFCQVDVFNATGYTVGQFIWLYLIAGYIRKYNVIANVHKYRATCLAVWLISSALWGVATIALHSGLPIDILHHPTTYNNPFTLCGGIAFFCLFTTFRFHSKVINYIAQSVLGVYLLFYLPVPAFYTAFIRSLVGLSYCLVGLVAAFLRFSIITGIDQFRRLIMIPIDHGWRFVANKWQKNEYSLA